MIGDILQPTHLLFILVIALIVLGPKRLPEVGRSLGRGLRDFRVALSTDEDDHRDVIVSQPGVPDGAVSHTSDPDAVVSHTVPDGITSTPSAENSQTHGAETSQTQSAGTSQTGVETHPPANEPPERFG